MRPRNGFRGQEPGGSACRGQGRGGRVRRDGRQDYLPCKGLPRRSIPKAGSADKGNGSTGVFIGLLQEY